MFRIVLALSFVAFLNPLKTSAQEPAVELRAEKPKPSPEDRLNADPNDVEALNAFFGAEINGVYGLIDEEKLEEAEAKLEAAGKFVSGLEPTEDAAKKLKSRFPLYRESAQLRIDVVRTPLEDLQQKLEEKTNNILSFRKVLMKYSLQISPLTRKEPEKAERMVVDAKAYFDSVKDQAEDPENEQFKKLMDGAVATFKSLQRTIDSEKTQRLLIGQAAPPISGSIQTWANGPILSDDELHGKVVMLDFWAVWCGPCIATFPHLREWKAKYGEQGFEIVGITRYYNFKWDAEANKAVSVKKEEAIVALEEEQAMLGHFAELHKLTHPFAVQDEDGTIAKHFGVTGIPTVAVLDRKGKIRLIRVGSGAENARDIEQMIETLINE